MVIGIIALLISILLPALAKARAAAVNVKCLSNMRQLYMGCSIYAQDYKEYPTNYKYSDAPSWNWGDECQGLITGDPPASTPYDAPNSTYWPGTFYPNQTIETINMPDWVGKKSAFARLLAAKGCVPEAAHCPALNPGDPGVCNQGVYVWNGPHTTTVALDNNSNYSGITVLSMRHCVYFPNATRGMENWGVCYGKPVRVLRYVNGGPRQEIRSYPTADVGFFVCPSTVLSNGTNASVIEPHNTKMMTALPGNGVQFDWNPGGYNDSNYPKDMPYGRNVMYADGHAVSFQIKSRRALAQRIGY